MLVKWPKMNISQLYLETWCSSRPEKWVLCRYDLKTAKIITLKISKWQNGSNIWQAVGRCKWSFLWYSNYIPNLLHKTIKKEENCAFPEDVHYSSVYGGRREGVALKNGELIW